MLLSKIKRLVLFLLLLFGVNFSAAASGQRIATVNLERTFNSYYRTKIIEEDFAAQSQVYRNYIARQAEQLRRDEELYRQKRDASLNVALAPEERKRREEEVKNIERDLQRRRAELEQYAKERAQALQESANTERRKVIEEIKAEVARRAAIEGYALVLDASGMSLNETSIVLYSIDSIDITEKVITELNRGAQVPPAAAPAGASDGNK